MVKLKSLVTIAISKYLFGYKKLLISRYLLQSYSMLMLEDNSLPKQDYDTIFKRVSAEGYEFLSKTLPKLGKAIESGIASKCFVCPVDFKCRRDSPIPQFLGSVVLEIFTSDGQLRSDASPDAVLLIRQICYYAYKTDLPYTPEQAQSVIDNFVSTEVELQSLHVEDDPIIKLAQLHIYQLFKDYKFNPKLLKHGPGVTANVPISKKWDHRLEPMPSVERFRDFFFFNASDVRDRLSRHPVYSSFDYFQGDRNSTAKVLLVPKDSRGPRLISCEPCENQWIQQAICRYMVDTIESSTLVNFDVNFTDQTWNQTLALQGSKDGLLATLDLKEASDRNSLELFNKLFALVPELRDDILSCRSSSTILPDGTELPLLKFAPMGSALCFPVMAISLWSLTRSYFMGLGFDSPPQLKIYGDDIIVPSFLSDGVSTLIERYGFKVNRAKSFSDSLFTESCGADCFKGKDVTPIKLRKLWNFLDFEGKNNRWVVPTIRHANLLDGVYPALSEYCYSAAEFFTGPLPYGNVSSPYLARLSTATSTQERGTFTGLQVIPLTYEEPDQTGWGHLSRVRAGIGLDGLEMAFGEYNLPKRWKLEKRRFKIQRLLAFGQA